MLMGTDAPESMGFRVNYRNNVYISLFPDTRDETRRLFDVLASGGTVEMDLQDNEGRLPDNLTVDDLKSKHLSRPHNPIWRVPFSKVT